MENNKLSNEERLMAYLDGELSPAEAAKVEAAVAGNSQAAQLLEDLRAMQGTLQSLPRRKLGSDFAGQVVRAAQQRAVSEDQRDDENGDSGEVLPLETLPLSSRPAANRRGRTPLIWLSMAAAAMLAAVIFFPAGDQSSVARHEASVAMDDSAPVSDATEEALEVAPVLDEAVVSQLNVVSDAKFGQATQSTDQNTAEELQNARPADPRAANYRTPDESAAGNSNGTDRNAAREQRDAPESELGARPERAAKARTDKPNAVAAEPRAPAAEPRPEVSGAAAPASPPAAKSAAPLPGRGGAGGGKASAGFAPSANRANAKTPPGAPPAKSTVSATTKGRVLRDGAAAPADALKDQPGKKDADRGKELSEQQQKEQRQLLKKVEANARRAVATMEKAKMLKATAAPNQVLVVELTVPRLTWESGEFEELLCKQAVVLTNQVQQATLVDALEPQTKKAGEFKGAGLAQANAPVADAAVADVEKEEEADTAAQDGVFLVTTDVQLEAILNELKNRPQSFLAVQQFSTADLRLANQAVRKALQSEAKQFGGQGGADKRDAQKVVQRSRQAANLKAPKQLARQHAGRAQRVRVVEPAALLKNLASNKAQEAEKAGGQGR